MIRIMGCPLDGRTGHQAGRHLLAQLYREETGQELPEIQRETGGKPYFEDCPWHFSITHTPAHAFCVLSDRPVGIEAEELSRDVRLRLADRILSPGERKQYEDAKDKKRAILTFWVMKEAAAKLTGEGIRGFANHTNFSLDDPRVTEMDGCIVAVFREGDNYAV